MAFFGWMTEEECYLDQQNVSIAEEEIFFLAQGTIVIVLANAQGIGMNRGTKRMPECGSHTFL